MTKWKELSLGEVIGMIFSPSFYILSRAFHILYPLMNKYYLKTRKKNPTRDNSKRYKGIFQAPRSPAVLGTPEPDPLWFIRQKPHGVLPIMEGHPRYKFRRSLNSHVTPADKGVGGWCFKAEFNGSQGKQCS